MTRSVLAGVLRLGCLAAAIAVASCGGGDVEADPFATERWSVEASPVRIGSLDDPDYAFQAVGALAMSPSGVLHSLHRGEASVRRWNARGEPVGILGREGEGPGEFDTPSALGFFGDSLWVMDRRAYRVSLFDPDARFLGSVSPRVDMSPDPDNPAASAPRPSIPLRDGSIYGISPAWSDAIARGQLSEAKHVRMDPEGEILGTVWVQPYESTDVLALLRDVGGTYGPQPFADDPVFLVDPDGALLVLDRRVFEGVGDATVSVTRIAMNGDTLLARDLAYAPEPLPSEVVDSAVRAQAEGMFEFMRRMDPELSRGKLEEDLRAAMFDPDYRPAVRAMKTATDGSVWLERFDRSEGDAVWWVLSEDFEPRATVVTPAGLRVLLIEGDAMWGVETDEFDVNYIVKYDIVR